MRARLRRTYVLGSSQNVGCDRNGNNLLMIAPNNHLPYRKFMLMENVRAIKLEDEEKTKEDEKKDGKAKK